MSLIAKSRAGRAYTRRMLIAMTFYMLALLVAVSRFKHTMPSHATAVFLSILPSIPILAVIVIVGMYLREERDEFQRQMLVQALLWGMGGTLAITSVWGFLENFHQARHLPSFYVFMIFWLIVGAAGFGLRLYYRGGADA